MLARHVVEALGYALLVALGSLVVVSMIALLEIAWLAWTDGELSLAGFLGMLPLIRLAGGVLACVLVLLAKWLVIGRFRAGAYPLYSTYVWRTELVERLEENLAEPALVHLCCGTVWIGVWFRALGATVGRRPYLDHCIITEPDLVTLGDFVTMDSGATAQAHLFQDRVRTTGPIVIGDGCSIGSNSVVLLGCEMEARASISALSLLMRHETVPVGSRWHGCPAVSVVDAAPARKASFRFSDMHEHEKKKQQRRPSDKMVIPQNAVVPHAVARAAGTV